MLVSEINWSDCLSEDGTFLKLDGLGLEGVLSIPEEIAVGILHLSCCNNQLTGLNLIGLSNLQVLSCYNNQLAKIDLVMPPTTVGLNTPFQLLDAQWTSFINLRVPVLH